MSILSRRGRTYQAYLPDMSFLSVLTPPPCERAFVSAFAWLLLVALDVGAPLAGCVVGAGLVPAPTLHPFIVSLLRGQ